MLLNYSIEIITIGLFFYIAYVNLVPLFKSDNRLTDELLMEGYVELQRRKALRARAFLNTKKR